MLGWIVVILLVWVAICWGITYIALRRLNFLKREPAFELYQFDIRVLHQCVISFATMMAPVSRLFHACLWIVSITGVSQSRW